MTLYLQFVLAFCFIFGLMTIGITWFFRTSTASIVWKIGLPLTLVVASCWVPFTVKSLMGRPIETNISNLPNNVKLLAFLAHDNTKKVDLWVLNAKQGSIYPTSYEVSLDENMKKTLKQAGERFAQQKAVYLRKGNGSDVDLADDDYDENNQISNAKRKKVTGNAALFDKSKVTYEVDSSYDKPDMKE